MEFVPFKPVAEAITFVPNNGSDKVKDHTLLRRPKPITGVRLSKYAFIEKHNLRQLKTDSVDSGSSSGLTYYYEEKSRTVFELNDSGPVVFMKTNPETTKYLIELNGLN